MYVFVYVFMSDMGIFCKSLCGHFWWVFISWA